MMVRVFWSFMAIILFRAGVDLLLDGSNFAVTGAGTLSCLTASYIFTSSARGE